MLTLMIAAGLGILGLCLGNFVNALVWRLHERSAKKNLSKKQKKSLSIWTGRSMCPHCRHTLAWYDLIPVISWVSLKGLCRYCQKPIGWQYPLTELTTALLFLLSYWAWPYGLEQSGITIFGFWLCFLVGFVALVVYDLRWMELPNKIVYLLIGLAAVQTVVLMIFFTDNPFGVLGDAFWGFVVIGGLFYALFQLSDGRWIGGGDVKLGFMIGLLVGGPVNSLLVIFFAALAGTVMSLPLMAMKLVKADSRIPFGPFLLAATFVVYLYGVRISDWYIHYFL